MFRSGFISIIGRPNVGKSTFLNHIIGEKITITSDKPQTTRNSISGIVTRETSQMIFIDTPGIHKPKHKLGQFMTNEALRSMSGVDLILYMVDATEKIGRGEEFICNELQDVTTPIYLLVNKVDLIDDIVRLKAMIDQYKTMGSFKGIFTISAKRGDHLDKIIDDIESMLPEGPKYYPDDQVTDHPERFIMGELIREKVLQLTHHEVPHSVMCHIDYIRQDEELSHVLNIHASIIVERDSQKGIIIGKGGRMIKKIGTLARNDILQKLGSKVFLDLHCRVDSNWRNRSSQLQEYGYTSE